MHIKQLSINNYQELISLWQRAGLKHKPLGRDSLDSLKIQLEHSNVVILGMAIHDVLIGTIMITHDNRRGWINRLAIDPSYRNQGFAEQLIIEAENYLQSCGIGLFACHIEDDNMASLNLFQKMGYKVHNDILYLSKRTNSDV
jgi:N-acetylglutamate synthase